MAQFALYRNKNARTKSALPLLLDIQSELLEDLQTRVVIPLAQIANLARNPINVLTPLIEIETESYLLMTPQLSGIHRDKLGAPRGSLAEHRSLILAALEFLIDGF